MGIDRILGKDWWFKISEDPKRAFSESYADDERTKPLSNVVELRKFATRINLLQHDDFSENDRSKGAVLVSVEKDQMLRLSEEAQRHLELEEFIPVGETANVFVSTSTRNLFLGVVIEDKRITFSFNPKVSFLSIKMECLENGEWITGEEKPLDNYEDPRTILDIFEQHVNLVGRSGSA